MTAKLTFNGIEILVPTTELGEALRQLSPLTVHSQPAPSAERMNGNAEYSIPIRFLQAILDSGQQGAGLEFIMLAVKTDKPKGVGGRTAGINGILKRVGFNNENVYTSERDSTGERRWKAGPELGAALKALERKASEAG